jgi:ribosomal-protein-alanine N-acetyltransferase
MAEHPEAQVPQALRLETRRCVLRYPVLDDAPRLLSAFRSPTFPQYVPLGRLTSAEQVMQWIEGSQTRWAQGQGYTWAIEQASDGKLVGQVSLTRMPEAGAWALAYWTHPDCWGEGYATEAARQAAAFAFQQLGATRIWAGVTPWNHGSRRVLEKLGMIYLADNPEGYRLDGEPVPTQEYEITAAAWDAAGRSARAPGEGAR